MGVYSTAVVLQHAVLFVSMTQCKCSLVLAEVKRNMAMIGKLTAALGPQEDYPPPFPPDYVRYLPEPSRNPPGLQDCRTSQDYVVQSGAKVCSKFDISQHCDFQNGASHLQLS